MLKYFNENVVFEGLYVVAVPEKNDFFGYSYRWY